MNHVKIRRMALAVASISLGTLTTLVMIGSSVVGEFTEVSAEEFLNSRKIQSQEIEQPISCTSLAVERLLSYDGKYIEDGLEREVQDVAAIMLYNSKDTVIPYAYITVYTQNCKYTFNAYMIPPKASVLVPEETAQKLTESHVVRTFGWTTVKEEGRRVRLDIEEVGMGCFRVTNMTGSKVHDLTIYHRTYIPEESFYMGGKAFQTHIPYIAPGNTVLVYPENYVSGYSKIIYYE